MFHVAVTDTQVRVYCSIKELLGWRPSLQVLPKVQPFSSLTPGLWDPCPPRQVHQFCLMDPLIRGRVKAQIDPRHKGLNNIFMCWKLGSRGISGLFLHLSVFEVFSLVILHLQSGSIFGLDQRLLSLGTRNFSRFV